MAACVAAVLATTACSGDSKPVPTPPGGFTGGGADAHVTVGGKTWDYTDGICEKSAGDGYISVNIGNPADQEYFGIVAGQYPGSTGTPKAATGGGEFAGKDQVVVTFQHQRQKYLANFAKTKVTLAPDVATGSFTSELTTPDADGNVVAVSGTFVCKNPPTIATANPAAIATATAPAIATENAPPIATEDAPAIATEGPPPIATP